MDKLEVKDPAEGVVQIHFAIIDVIFNVHIEDFNPIFPSVYDKFSYIMRLIKRKEEIALIFSKMILEKDG